MIDEKLSPPRMMPYQVGVLMISLQLVRIPCSPMDRQEQAFWTLDSPHLSGVDPLPALEANLFPGLTAFVVT
jgi:hypothetical protein